ncbi:hypothetical protein EHI8A_141770 [Entamoeba histolytica HM-1:IMSS-B]|uniref:Uncharacterized protein n=8 Tax=Entamoeba TaxID=5758 RepID=C4LTH6_ENTH1|nr:hypothetical protein ENU1_115100 [Entamoeba nuttalli P19]XP_653807.1 hypothetical protein EHI_011800 [Entamoeba histolytica HM-1:IMSS]EMD42472.1 Hypothetical protein EHI5A_109960 [Entamoeba histolytica KU27]EMH75004.1 hypothetical protein EHI8A_141770 [Entamoeba histolytica HM-1:IMSS-B]EMS10919.1 hypothetical protein KM1_132160 [Entamoeba histolytica HM-3:IMSS]ENY64157.1 hypothetical protein EHI7A_071890 [Entamoeba histolytica HM-1:IMSS-A]GAT91866.1 hypothetical protein CL6EHI_011800 [Enta|eukprot:XP_008857888.1 hypothetical protein ENU1_115100 [Entamoeba nuttalli P19]
MNPLEYAQMKLIVGKVNSKPKKDTFNLDDKKEWDCLKRSSKTFEACQQGALLGVFSLLGMKLEIEKVYKKSTKTSPLLNVRYVSLNNERIDIHNNVQSELDTAKQRCDSDKKWASRLIKRSMDAIAFGKLLEVAEKASIQCQMKKTRKAEFTVVMQKVKSISTIINGFSYLLDKEHIRDFGLAVNHYIVQKMAGSNRKTCLSERIIYVQPNDFTILQLFKKYVMKTFNKLSAFTPVKSELLEYDGSCLEVKSLCIDSSNTSDDIHKFSFTCHI